MSDTHNTRPDLPQGDLLLHAGDLSNDGSFEEIQTQLDWLSSQRFQHKVVIAGNHEVLLDIEFLEKHPERNYDSNRSRSANDLNWGSVIYLQDELITLKFYSKNSNEASRALRIYGSPWTPRYGISAFQESPDEDIWTNKVTNNTDILLTHDPPYKHLDGFLSAGCRFLAIEIERVRPNLVVCGHIHVGRGQEDIVFNGAQRCWEGIRAGETSWPTVIELAMRVLCLRLFPSRTRSKGMTKLVNASIVSGDRHEYRNSPIIVQI